ncbi:sporulation protein YunB [Oceanirhabdus seepicola]|uniref:Sporulation protein YunB n=1 Tax=Oceanirhabdus seepicola TaxID=2828781 RepID=A0A9J6P8J7_9CLOT|nr:sporulation protein YunB [Oceanirhabdus seepicola]MCM1992524.1 sporulation protein YunB [Oceanirhabdus seepicola]
MGYKKRIRKKKSFRRKLVIILIIIFILSTVFIYLFDHIVTPTVMAVSEAEMKAKSLEVINKSIIDEFTENFDYNEVITIERDNDGSIVLLKADTLKLNKIACTVALKSQTELNELGNVGIKLPIGYITRNNILSYLGPPITVKMQPLGYVEANYISNFESAGINQTRHKIYVNVKSRVRIILPLMSKDIEVSHQIAIAETIIVGKVPETALQLNLDKAGFNLNSAGSL